MFYRKKPVVIEAIQWTGDNVEQLGEWGATVLEMNTGALSLFDSNRHIIDYVSVGEYVVKYSTGIWGIMLEDDLKTDYEPVIVKDGD